ncbi:MAG: MerR family transcriptional regulator [Oscillospiraceae bacterium]|jgi:DNA-binding transcriptional MerR regulator|nr:MerR family transcriptional regulator [Oscillospiraceae bacterium]
MEYSIQELARLSGVTTRTLRWYDQIGLLKPGRVAENGYRRYGPAQVDRLQDILYYRALGVELAQIRVCLDDPDFDRLATLRGHLARLEGERTRLDGLIRSVTDTIHAEERNEIMRDEQKFEVFKRQAVERNEALYGREVREQYGDAQMDEANAAVMGLTQEQYQTWTGLGEEIREGLEYAVAEELPPEGEEGRRIAALHRRWLTLTGNRYDPGKHRGLAALYTEDPRFTAYYDRNLPGCAQFLRDAVERWAETL